MSEGEACPMISVALATYNGEDYLAAQLDSIEAQSWPAVEIIVADDGSTDATPRLLAGRPWRRPVRILDGPGHLGVVGNFGRALAACRGDYVALADQDDVWLPDKLGLLAARAAELERRHGAGAPVAVFSDLALVDAQLRPLAPSYFRRTGKSPHCRRLRDFLLANHVPGCALLVNRALLQRALPIPEGFRMHDWWLLMVAAAFGAIGCVDRPLVQYRQHGANTCGARAGRAPWFTRAGKLFQRDAWQRLLMPPPERVAWLRRNIALFEDRFGMELPPAAAQDLALFHAGAASGWARLRFLATARTSERAPLAANTLKAAAAGWDAGAAKAPPTGGVTLVTVTYGRRWHFLRQVLEAARHEGIERAVVVDNGAQEDIARLARAEFGDFAQVLKMGCNTGSAGGFGAGIARALALGADYLLLLDDDNRLEAGSLSRLREAHAALAGEVPVDALAVLACRPQRQADVAAGVPASGMGAERSAFFGFRLADLPFKLFRRTAPGRRWIAARSPVPQVTVAIAPYSGLFFHRAVPLRHGLPDERFVLYADDSEFSYRLTRAGGRIVMVTDARLEDLEPSWNLKAHYGSTFDALLLGDSDARAFYSTRNNAYFERWRRNGSGWLRAINRGLYLCALRLRAVMIRRGERFELLMRAIRDGEAGRLGEHPQFPLNAPPAGIEAVSAVGPMPVRTPAGRQPDESLWIAGLPVLRSSAARLRRRLLAALERGEQTALFFANTNFVVQCTGLREHLREPGVLIVNDGVGMAIAARLMHGRGFPDNLNGTDFLPPLLAAARAPVFLLGSRPGVAERAAARLAQLGVTVAGCRDGYAGMANEAALVAAIEASGARILVAALGNPLQERWLLEHRAQLAPTLLIGAGALLDFLAGEVPRAPAWVRRARLEWLYRLSREPRRLVRRYTLDVVAFLRLCWADGPGLRASNTR